MGRQGLSLCLGLVFASLAWAEDPTQEPSADGGAAVEAEPAPGQASEVAPADAAPPQPETPSDHPVDTVDIGTEDPTLERRNEGPLHDAERPRVAGTPIEVVRNPDVIPDVYEVEVKSKIVPIYPDELAVLYGEQAIRCSGKAWIDADGRPLRVSLAECPDGFQMEALNAISRWRWEKPTVVVPASGLPVAVRTGFARLDRRFYPGVTFFAHPDEITSDPTRPVLLRGGKMPHYPKQVNAGDDACLLEFVVDAAGNTKSPIIDECAQPYRVKVRRVIRTWKWWWTTPPASSKDTVTLVTEILFKL